jgi:glycosyltransferase involved in cell wall biosynthesis
MTAAVAAPRQNHDLPRVSIVTAFYNRAATVRASLESLLAQDWPNLEIVAVDDGSTDGTAAILRSYSDPRLRVIVQANTGFTTAISRAVEAAGGDFIAMHDGGDVSQPGRVTAQATILMSRPEVGVVGCHVEDDGEDGAATVTLRPPEGLPFADTLMRRNLFTHGEVMYRRALYDAVGGYRPLFRFAQDRDLWMRMSARTDYAIVPEVLYRRLRIEGGVSTSYDKQILQAYLSDFAVQCAASRDADGRDLLDRHGDLAPYFRQPSPALAGRLAGFGLRWMLFRDEDAGWQAVTRGMREAWSPKAFAIWLACAAHRSPPLWKAVRPMLLWKVRRSEARLGKA